MKIPCSTKRGMIRPRWTQMICEKNFARLNQSPKFLLDPNFVTQDIYSAQKFTPGFGSAKLGLWTFPRPTFFRSKNCIEQESNHKSRKSVFMGLF